MNELWKSPLRNLIGGVIFVLVVCTAATEAYHLHGWKWGDALYMVIITIFTVGYGEVHPINTPALRDITMTLIVLGCTGMIFVTGALVQAITYSTLQQLFGIQRMKSQIASLSGHAIVCGFGRIGHTLARELVSGGTKFVLIERSEERLIQARELGYLCIVGDATDEATLIAAGVAKARWLVAVLPDDAANVFITLSARALNAELEIIARGETPSTETKLLQAGANEVVLPAYIGAERVAEIILYPTTASLLRHTERMRALGQDLGKLGLNIETIVIDDNSRYVWRTLAEIESQGDRSALIVAISHGEGNTEAPKPALRLMPGDSITILRRIET